MGLPHVCGFLLLLELDASHRYAVRARILVDGNPFFTGVQQNSALTSGAGNEVRILLRRVGTSNASGNAGVSNTSSGTPTSTAPLENTYWKLVRMGDTRVTVAPSQKEPYLVLDSKSRRMSGSGGCNRLAGSYYGNDDRLTFSRMALTIDGVRSRHGNEQAFKQTLSKVAQWKVAGQQLHLLDANGNRIAEFEARHMK